MYHEALLESYYRELIRLVDDNIVAYVTASNKEFEIKLRYEPDLSFGDMLRSKGDDISVMRIKMLSFAESSTFCSGEFVTHLFYSASIPISLETVIACSKSGLIEEGLNHLAQLQDYVSAELYCLGGGKFITRPIPDHAFKSEYCDLFKILLKLMLDEPDQYIL